MGTEALEAMAALFEEQAARHDEIRSAARAVGAEHDASAAYMIQDFCRRMARDIRALGGVSQP